MPLVWVRLLIYVPYPLMFWNMTMYTGAWKGNIIEGYGLLSTKNEYQYVGQFNNNKMDGLAVCTWDNGTCYKGQFKNNFRHGYGI